MKCPVRKPGLRAYALRKPVALAGVFSLLGLWLFRGLLFQGQTLFFRDFYRYFFPSRMQVLQLLRQQGLFAWNPYLDGGLPLLADLSHHFVLYPPALLFYVCRPVFAFNLLTWFHFAVAALGMAAFVLQRWRSMPAALVGGGAFALCGVMLSALDRPGYFYTAAWLPWVMLGWSGQNAVFLALIAAWQLFAGEVQIVFFSHLLGVTFAPLSRKTCWLGLHAGVLGALLAAVQWLPTLQLALLSTRSGGISADQLTINSLHPNRLLTLIYPFPFGLFPSDANFSGHQKFFHSDGLGLMASVHCGTVVFALACLGWWRARRKIAWALGFGFFLLMAFGKYSGVFFTMASAVLPGAKAFLFPIKYFLVCQVLIVVLASFAVATTKSRRWQLTLSILAVGELVFYAPRLIWTTPETFFEQQPLFAERLRGSAVGVLPAFRLSALDMEVQGIRPTASSGVAALAERRARLFRALNPNAAAAFEIAQIDKYGPLRLRATQELWNDSPLSILELCRLYSTRYFISGASLPPFKNQRVVERGRADGFGLFEDLDALPMAWITPVPVKDISSTRAALPVERRVVDHLSRGLNGYRISVDASQPSTLVVSENAYPGWQARLDGKPVAIDKAFGVLKAVALPAGRHDIEFAFDPWLPKLGFVLSMIGIAAAFRQWRVKFP